MDDLLIIKFLTGKTNSEESKKIVFWLNQNDDNRLHYFNLKRIWQESSANPNNEDFLNNSWDRLKIRMENTGNEIRRIEQRPEIMRTIKKLFLAASIAILFGTTLFFGLQNYHISHLKGNLNQIIVPLGSRSNIILPDGSSVWLNSGSTLYYRSDFTGKAREVILEGEGFFDVKHSIDNSPFFVSAGGLRIKVMGTTFNVKSYPDEDIIETTLVNGRVEVYSAKSDQVQSPIILSPNQKLTYIKKGSGMIVTAERKNLELKQEPAKISVNEKEDINNFKIAKQINPELSTSWKDGKLIFSGETLENLVPKLERYYNITISLEGDSIKSLKYSGTLEEVTIEQMLRALEKTSPIRFDINKNHVILTMFKK
jgi:transmembrane sensor